MTRFEESALRNSASDQQSSSSTLPYWHPSSQFSSLIDPQHDASIPHTASENGHPGSFPAYTDEQSSVPLQTSMDFELSRQMGYSQFNDFAPAVAQPLSQADLSSPDPSVSGMSNYSQGLSIKTPGSTRSMRRPGLAGAPALTNGHYCCQWSVNGVTCRHKFMDAKALNDHIRAQHVRGAGTFMCHWSGCDKGSFPTANKLVRHVHSHTGYKPFPCSCCPQAFVTKDQLDKHLTTHTGAKDFVCTWPGCGRSFAVKHALDGHVNSVHLKAKKHICPCCAQAFDDSSNLSKHKKQVHNTDTGIKCPARHTHGCMYVDSRKDKMKEHCERKCHGLETVTDAHAWNLWVQQFKTASRKTDSRRQSLLRSTASTPSYMPAPYRTGSIECSKQGCNIPVCLPCNILCNDVHSSHHDVPCHEADCDPHAPCDPCDPCDDPECEEAAWQPCTTQPCNLPHCGSTSVSSTPSLPATPHIPPDTYFQYAGGDLDAEHPFQMGQRLSEYMFMNA
ncbi:Zinc-responsive transcriptional regulator ZAP1 [Fulvia fulva]|uniref:Zinc-responsive transcriptional regulator ZAP1 n=1 Tax=Passalora fulva TaxID=5499 RepID=A0A9Q8L7S5_PASFU|nr:Zinc-responsive transcriptional regulator ZAP1 [Fulvia fulva]KAK4637590.1 Zinc-responsive transcriptional regulator ZAP1 [Fulvia fulva]UJO12370.1 Zinc-responsive transcriptional regulator ZAP1 [Fulvia fulva]